MANSLRQQESTPPATSQSPDRGTQRQADEEKIRSKNAISHARSVVAEVGAPLQAPKSLSNAEADLVRQVMGSHPTVLARQAETALSSFQSSGRSQPFAASTAASPARLATSSDSKPSLSAPSTPTATETSVGKSPQAAPIKTADNYRQMNGTGLGVPGQYGPGICGGNCSGWPQPLGQGSQLPMLSTNEQPLPVPTPLPTVRSEASSPNFSP
ncbi:MAG TPA: hypothetical protein V6D16_21585, partial [Candidatus Obscuribacterales bacterium]